MFFSFVIQEKEVTKDTCHWVCHFQSLCKTIATEYKNGACWNKAVMMKTGQIFLAENRLKTCYHPFWEGEIPKFIQVCCI